MRASMPMREFERSRPAAPGTARRPGSPTRCRAWTCRRRGRKGPPWPPTQMTPQEEGSIVTTERGLVTRILGVVVAIAASASVLADGAVAQTLPRVEGPLTMEQAVEL